MRRRAHSFRLPGVVEASIVANAAVVRGGGQMRRGSRFISGGALLVLTACGTEPTRRFSTILGPTPPVSNPTPQPPAPAPRPGGNAVPLVRLELGSAFRGMIRYPEDVPCDPSGWDASAPCLRFSVVPPTDGTLEVGLTWSSAGTKLDLLLGGVYAEAPAGTRTVRVSLAVSAMVEQEIRIHSYYGTSDFELTAALR